MKLMRPQFLIAGLALNILGTSVALHEGGAMDWTKFFLMQVVISSAQLAGALANEYADVRSDRLNKNRTWFSGGSGMLVSGRMEAKVVPWLVFLWTLTALLASIGLALVANDGLTTFLVMIVGISLALAYSLRPFSLSYKGLGEITMAFMVSFLTPVASFFVINGAFDTIILLATAPLVFQLLGLMMAVEYPDRDADIEAGKMNLVTRMSPTSSWRLGVLMLILGGVAAIAGGFIGLPQAAAALSGAVLLSEAVVFSILSYAPDSSRKYFWSTALSSGFYVLVILIITVAISA